MFKKYIFVLFFLLFALKVFAHNQDPHPVPADYFDLTHWKITLPTDKDNNGRADDIEGVAILSFYHPDFFFLDEDNNVVFQSLNKAPTTKNSKNTRSELRQMGRGTNTDIYVKSPKNNFALSTHPNAKEYYAIGGKLEATLKVNHVAINSNSPKNTQVTLL